MARKHQTHVENQSRPRKTKINWYAAIAIGLLAIVLLVVFSTGPTKRPTLEKGAPEISAAPTAYEFQKQGKLRFLSPKGRLIDAIDIEIAHEESKRELGLMYRERMAENQGMLFVFDEESEQSFWMKNTILSLDMIFVNGKNEIVTIHKYTTPYSEESFTSTKPARYVVEVNAGFTDKRGIAVGDQIAWSGL